MNPTNILQQIRQSKPKITVLGEGLDDVWHFGHFGAPAQEDPDVRRFIVKRTYTCSGGAANVRKSVAAITGTLVHGQPDGIYGRKFRYWSVPDDKLVFRQDRDIKCRRINLASTLYEPNLIIADYGKGYFDWQALEYIAKSSNALRVVFSPHLNTCKALAMKDLSAFRDWIWIANDDEREVLLRHLRQPIPATLIETSGDQEVLKWGPCRRTGTPVESVSSNHTVGIGDCFAAGFSAAYFSGIDLDESIEYAIWLARQVLLSKRMETCHVEGTDASGSPSRAYASTGSDSKVD